MSFRRLCLTAAVVAASVVGRSAWADGTVPKVDFVRDIRPILSNHCFHCHGPDAKARKAELRLDTKAGAFANRDGTRVLLPGNLKKSELYRRITTNDADERMPPKTEKRQLNANQIELLRRWIEQGAKWEEHWAFQKPTRPRVPNVRNHKRLRNAIDAFILARLERAGMSLSPEARRETLIRRVTLDLTGLPPTIAEIDTFLKDASPNAYEKVVDRLLASPAYGERMAWDWLDAARYADTNGFQGDPERTMWPWRDWLVNALNANKPFDEFTIEMLAGDLLAARAFSRDSKRNAPLRNGSESRLNEQQRLAAVIASGFNRNHMINGEGGRIAEETRVENVFDRTETTATVWMGLTMTCCRCHDHKYDPIKQREYYSLYAFFNNTSEDGRGRSGSARPNVSFLPFDAQRDLRRVESEIRHIAGRVTEIEKSSAFKKQRSKLPKVIQKLLSRPARSRDAKSLQQLAKHFRKTHSAYAKLLDQLRATMARRDGVRKRAVRVMVMDEMQKRRPTYILTRGLYSKPTVKVTRGTPQFLPPLPKPANPNRLTLAKWLVDPAHPLTARVTVNRVWQQFFGTGLVKTTEDFGIQGEKPSHPQLLDWLATEFTSPPLNKRGPGGGGWDVKRLHRLIVTSTTYRQSSKVRQTFQSDTNRRPTANAQHASSQAGKPDRRTNRDPANRLLSRFPRRRMPSWMLRDQALAISGLRVAKLGGPPVKPYQPPGVWAEATFGKKRYVQDHGDKLYRRSMYIFWRRIVGPTMFFDSAARQFCEVKPSRTNTPLHALTTLNDTAYVEAARLFAERVMRAKRSHLERVKYAFRIATARNPSTAESQILMRRLFLLRQQFKAEPKNAAELLKVGEFPRDANLPAVDHAAYASLCLLILNLDEVLSRE